MGLHGTLPDATPLCEDTPIVGLRKLVQLSAVQLAQARIELETSAGCDQAGREI